MPFCKEQTCYLFRLLLNYMAEGEYQLKHIVEPRSWLVCGPFCFLALVVGFAQRAVVKQPAQGFPITWVFSPPNSPTVILTFTSLPKVKNNKESFFSFLTESTAWAPTHGASRGLRSRGVDKGS